MSDWKFSVQDSIGILEFDKAESDVNVLNEANLKELSAHLDSISKNVDVKALLMVSAKPRIFIAGADIRLIEAISTKEQAVQAADQGKEVFQKIEDLKIPTISVINGPCLGGGYELSLACQWIVASFSEQIKIGLPEVNLGILPGFGGSIRLPIRLGLLKALPMLLTGKMASSQEAFKLGMVDPLFAESTLRVDAFQLAKDLIEGKVTKKKNKKSWMSTFLEDTGLGRDVVLDRARIDVLQKTKGFYPAPLKILKLVRQTYGKRNQAAYRKESEHFADLAITRVSKNLIQLFFTSEKYKKLAWTSVQKNFSEVKKCGILGAGVMGGGIAQLVSSRDILVRVKDISDKALGGALREAAKLFKDAVKRKRLKKAAADFKMGLISVSLMPEGLKTSDFIIEAVVEDLAIKQKVFREFAEITPKETILASNTSSLSVTKMAEGCRDPERIVGLHFFNPVHRMPLVEVIRAEKTSDETLERTVRFARRLGKTVVVTADRPGFLVNRLLLPYMNEAAFLFEEGVPMEVIDGLAKKFGMPMGPIELADVVGIDVAYKVAHILEEAFGDRMKVASILGTIKEKGWLGKKTGKGFYSHDGKKIKPNHELGVSTKSFDSRKNEDAVKRMIYVMVNEAARVIEEKVVDSAATVDMGMIMGTGFPPFKGGLLRFADSVGLQNIVQDLKRFHEITGRATFEPSPLLTSLASQNSKFYA